MTARCFTPVEPYSGEPVTTKCERPPVPETGDSPVLPVPAGSRVRGSSRWCWVLVGWSREEVPMRALAVVAGSLLGLLGLYLLDCALDEEGRWTWTR